MLMQHRKVIAYDSRQLNVHDKNYLSHDLELEVMVFPFKIWRNYSYDVHVYVYTDHNCLQYFFNKKKVNL